MRFGTRYGLTAELIFRVGFESGPEEIGMSESGNSQSWLERHWYWIVIALGVIFVMCLNLFHPAW